jgi:CRISPR-associated protein (TIGR03986 family)
MARHKDPSRNDRVAFAPFNFVPLPEVVFVPEQGGDLDHGCYHPERYSGAVELSLTVETPLYIRCAPPASDTGDKDPRNNPARQHFFHHGDPDIPVIPGSSLRGMVRNLVEVLGYGKFQWFLKKKFVYRAVGDISAQGEMYRQFFLGDDLNHGEGPLEFQYPSPNVKGGYLEVKNGKYAIRPALEYEGESFVHVEYHDINWARQKQAVYSVFVKPAARKLTTGRGRGQVNLWLACTDKVAKEEKPGLVKAKLVVSGRMGGEHPKHMHCAVYEPNPEAELISIDENIWELYLEDANMTRGELTPTRVLRPGDPLFYLMNQQGLVFFGPTMMFRLPYTMSTEEYVPRELCKDSIIDLAEAIFGVVRGSQFQDKATVRGRVFFEDAEAVCKSDREIFHEPVSPKILGGPKATAFQQYLTQDEPDNKETLRHYGDDPKNTTLRGHKFYWHKRFQEDKYWEQRIVTSGKQHTAIRSVVPGTGFRGRVRFENLTLLELGALLTAIELQPDMRHKLGMGKPLGMGSVCIKSKLKIIDRNKRYSRLLDDDGRLATGEMDTNDCSNKAAEAKKAFAAAMINHYNQKCGPETLLNPDSDLWAIPRLRELGLMLSWAPQREDPCFDYPPLDPRSNGIDGKYWRKRKVIPTPSYLVDNFGGRCDGGTGLNPVRKGPPPRRSPIREMGLPQQSEGELKPGQKVIGNLLEKKTKKGKWLVSLKEGCQGVVMDSEKVPADVGPGDRVRVLIDSVGKPNCNLKWMGKE